VERFDRNGVQLLNCARLKSIQERSVTLIRNMSHTVPDPRVSWAPLLPDNIKNPFGQHITVEERDVEVAADLVVLAVGMRPNNTLYDDCLSRQAAPEVRNIGDSFAVGRVFEAVRSGDAMGRSL